MKQYKMKFLEKVNTNSTQKAAQNSVRAALSRCKTYNGDSGRREFREDFIKLIVKISSRYTVEVSQTEHEKNIVEISDYLSAKHQHILINGRLRIGQAQKALNLYLKYLWCLEKLTVVPPNCPIDSIVLQGAGLTGKWTALDCIDTYNQWHEGIKKYAVSKGFNSSQEWELITWNTNA